MAKTTKKTVKKINSKKESTSLKAKKETKADLIKAKVEIIDDNRINLKAKVINKPTLDKDNKFKLKNGTKKVKPTPHDQELSSEYEEAESPKSVLDIAAQQAEKAYEENNNTDFINDDLGLEITDSSEKNNSKALIVRDSKVPTSTDPLVLYLNEIRKYPLLTKEQEIEIAKKYYETKDPNSAQLLVRSNLRFVVKVAAEYSKFGAKLIDLIQEGNVGLMHAVREFNPYKGARLITYAVWWIRGYIQEYLMRQYSMVRIGTTQNQRKLFYQLQKEKDKLESLSNKEHLKELSERLGIPEDEILIMAQRLSGRDISLDKPIDDDSPASLSDFQKASTSENIDEALAREELLYILKDKIKELEPVLSDREKIILKERLLNDEPLTLQEIGEKYGITREAVRQMEARLIKKIKDKMDAI